MKNRLLLLTAHPELYTPRRLCEEAVALGGEVCSVAPPGWWTRSKVRAPAGNGWIAVARPGPFTLRTILRSLRDLGQQGVWPAQSRRALLDACDQWRTLQVLAAAAVPLPVSRIMRFPHESRQILDAIPGPWIIKGRRGSRGSHVARALSPGEARRLLRFYWGQGGHPVVQEDLSRLGGVFRVLVSAQRVLATARATAAPGEFRTNWHRGGTFRTEREVSAAIADCALRAVAAVGLPFAGVDIMGDEDPRVLEVNASPGIEGLEGATGQNLARRLVEDLYALEASSAAGPAGAADP